VNRRACYLHLAIRLLKHSFSAWWISDRQRLNAISESSPYLYRATSGAPVPPSDTFVGQLTAHPVWIALSADIFTGQIIASLIVLTFVAVFLLREWISQNARPGVFEDEDVFPEEVQQQAVPHAPRPVQQRQVQLNPLDETLAQRQIEALRAIDTLRAREGINGHMVGDDRRHHGRSPIQRARRKAKTKEASEDPLNSFEGMHVRSRRRLHSTGSSEETEEQEEEEKCSEQERMKRRAFSRRVYAARLLGARRRAALTGNTQPRTPMDVDPAFDFTFKAELPKAGRRSNSEPLQKPSVETGTEHATAVTSPTTPIFPTVTLEPPRGSIPFSFDRLKTPSPLLPPTSSTDERSSDVRGMNAGIKQSASSSSLSLDKARRPPLPTTSVGPAASFMISPPRTPLESPSLATYRAPEELEVVASPSRLNGYFGPDQADEEENSETGEDSDTEEDISGDKRTMKDRYFEVPDAPSRHVSPSGLLEYSDTDEGDDEDQENKDEDYQSDTDGDSMESDDDEGDEGEANRLMLFNEDDWAIEVQVVQQPAGGAAGLGPVLPVQGGVDAVQPPPDGDGGALDVNEEAEGNVEDDMDGAMEGKLTSLRAVDIADPYDVQQ
jgi:E3 ubiquitin-protein ligase MARCH6